MSNAFVEKITIKDARTLKVLQWKQRLGQQSHQRRRKSRTKAHRQRQRRRSGQRLRVPENLTP